MERCTRLQDRRFNIGRKTRESRFSIRLCKTPEYIYIPALRAFGIATATAIAILYGRCYRCRQHTHTLAISFLK